MDASEKTTAPSPAPRNSNYSMPPHGDLVDAGAHMPDGIGSSVQEDFPFHVSSPQEDWMSLMTDCMFSENYGHGHRMMHVDAVDESSSDLWDNRKDITSQIHEDASSLACRSMCPTHCSRSETSGTNMDEASDAFIQLPLPGYSEAPSFAAYQHNSPSPYINNHVDENLGINPCVHSMPADSMCAPPSPALISGSASETYFANASFIHPSPMPSEASPGTYFADASFIHPSPMPSEVSSPAAPHPHEPFYTSDHVDYYHDWQMRMHPNPTYSVHASIMPDFVDGDMPAVCSAGAASILPASSNDDFEDEATSFASLSLHEQNLALHRFQSNPEATASQPQPNLEAEIHPLHVASHYNTHTSGVVQIPSAGEALSFLVPSSIGINDDGYVWRKYGQKSIKERAHPRLACSTAHRVLNMS